MGIKCRGTFRLFLWNDRNLVQSAPNSLLGGFALGGSGLHIVECGARKAYGVSVSKTRRKQKARALHASWDSRRRNVTLLHIVSRIINIYIRSSNLPLRSKK